MKRATAEEPPPISTMPIRHFPGPPVDSVQRCSRCSAILLDGRGAMAPLEANGSARQMRAWGPGAVIDFGGGISLDRGNWTEATDCDEVPS